MGKNKILRSILLGLSFGFILGYTTNALSSGAIRNVSLKDVITEGNLQNYQYVDILGKKYDLSLVNPAVIQTVIRTFDYVNSGNANEKDKNERLREVSKLLDDYLDNPEDFVNFPVTLDLGPWTFLMEEIQCIQSRISDLKDKQSVIKTEGNQGNISLKINEIQDEIDGLSRWINYSVENFNSSTYKRTFYDSLDENKVDDGVIFSCVYPNLDFEDVFRVSVNSEGNVTLQDENIPLIDLVDTIKSNLEFENIKIRYLREKIKDLTESMNQGLDLKSEILNLRKEVESVKVYEIGQEIILLNLEKEAVKNTKISAEFMEEKLNNLQEIINEKVKILKEFNEKIDRISDYSIETTIGDTPSYNGYYIEDDSGLGVKITFDKNGKVLFDGSYELSNRHINVVNNVIPKLIREHDVEVSDLKSKRSSIESGNSDKKYYLIDTIDKKLCVLENDIENYKTILSCV